MLSVVLSSCKRRSHGGEVLRGGGNRQFQTREAREPAVSGDKPEICVLKNDMCGRKQCSHAEDYDSTMAPVHLDQPHAMHTGAD